MYHLLISLTLLFPFKFFLKFLNIASSVQYIILLIFEKFRPKLHLYVIIHWIIGSCPQQPSWHQQGVLDTSPPTLPTSLSSSKIWCFCFSPTNPWYSSSEYSHYRSQLVSAYPGHCLLSNCYSEEIHRFLKQGYFLIN